MPGPTDKPRGTPVPRTTMTRTFVIGLISLSSVIAPPFAGRARADGVRSEPAAVAFDGFGLGAFSGAGSVAAALRQTKALGERRESGPLPVDLAVRGPTGNLATPPTPLATEVRSRIERFDVAAGVRVDPTVVDAGPAHWTGRIGLKSEGEKGVAALELRTTVGRWRTDGRLGVELGPRLERRLRHGATFFIDGKAEAQAIRSPDGGWWALPGTAAADGAGMVGVTARTGLIR